MRTLVIGCGYIGLSLAEELARQGHEVFGMRRHVAGEEAFSRANVKPLYADITKPKDLSALPGPFDWVINCVASRGGTVEDYRRIYLLGTQNILDWLQASPPKKYVYTSSTSVYGQNNGSVVVETDPVTPAAETSRVLVATENLLINAADQRFPVVILRLAGIYGPGRGYWLQQFLSGAARMDGAGTRYLNMIHRDDVVGAIVAALKSAPAPSVYNVVDNEPVTQREFFSWLATKLNKPVPPSIEEEETAVRKRGTTNKRVSNQRLKEQLGYQFKFPTFRQGYSVEIAKLDPGQRCG
jgi:nucleoside-diphosphate-sugar epimerase